MKLQTALKLLLIIAFLFGTALVSNSGNATRYSGVCSEAPLYPSEVKSEGCELARQGFQVGQA